MSLMARIRAFLNPTAGAIAATAALQKSFDSERRLWTTKGHMLVSELENRPQWVIEEGGKAVTFIDEWVTKEGESVSRATHHLDTKPLTSETIAGDVK